MRREDISEYLRAIPDEEFLVILEQVFRAKQPNPEESPYNRNHYFRGIAESRLESTPGEPETWGPWSVEAVAYINRVVYPEGTGPDWGFCQFGTCTVCGTKARSNVKSGVCPICGGEVELS
ncbi:MAG TPA: hypothetical protein VGK74_04675 [Symbiobacteriaceae bacterium]|jgi:hypothetical protein